MFKFFNHHNGIKVQLSQSSSPFSFSCLSHPIMDLSNDEFRDLVLAELNHCDLNKTSLKTLKKLLEERLKCDLTEVAS